MKRTQRIQLLAARGERTAAERDELRELFRATNTEDMHVVARENRVGHVVGSGLVEAGLLERDSAWWRALDENATAKKMLFTALSEVFVDLEARRIRCTMVESAAVAAHTDMPLRSLGSGDADLLVDHARFDDALEVFADHAFHPSTRDGRTETCRVELSRAGSPLLRAEIGERAFDRHWTPLPFARRERHWLDRSRTCVHWPGLRTPCSEDLLVQVATHTSMHSFVRAPGLRLHVDVDRMVRRCRIDWSLVVEETRALGANTRVWLSLWMAKRLLGTPVPTEPLGALRPRAFRARALSRLVAKNGVFEDGRAKLPPLQSVVLDILLEDAAPTSWLWRNVLPNRDWLNEHFGQGDDEPRALLQLRRLAAATTRWRPR